MIWRRCLFYLTVVLFWFSARGCPYRVGFYNLDSNGSQWIPTLNAMTAPDALNQSNCSFELQAYTKQLDLVGAIVNLEVDFVIVNPGLMVCLLTQYKLTLIASLINFLQGQETTVYGGNILVRADSDIHIIHDLNGKTAISGAPDSTALFQIQAEAVLQAGYNVFENLQIMAFNPNQSVIMLELLNGNFDAAFLRADMVGTVLDALSESHDLVRAIDTSAFPGYPYEVTGGVYPEWSIAALPHVPLEVRTAAAASLYAIRPTDPGAVRQKYYGWTIPYNYFEHEELQRDLGIMNSNGICVISDDDDYYAYVSCPSGTLKLTKGDMNKRCSAFPQCNKDGVACVCSPCFRPVAMLLFGLKGILFWFVVVTVWVSIMLSGWVMQGTLLGSNLLIEVPFEHLTFSRNSGAYRRKQVRQHSKSNDRDDGAAVSQVCRGTPIDAWKETRI